MLTPFSLLTFEWERAETLWMTGVGGTSGAELRNSRFKAYSMAAESRSRAVGASASAASFFDGARNLRNTSLGRFTEQASDHSGQFNRSYLYNRGFYTALLQDMEIRS